MSRCPHGVNMGRDDTECEVCDSKEMKTSGNTNLDFLFAKQRAFMELLRENDRFPEFPVDLTTKAGQRLAKEVVWNLVEELAEASFILKNRAHRATDDRALDLDHYKEEIGDAFAYLMELCILSGIDAQELFNEYVRKNQIVVERFRGGY